MQKGDLVYGLSDGYADQFGGPKGKKLKYSTFEKMISGFSNQPVADQSRVIERTFESWKGDLDQIDDVMVLGIKIP